MSFNFRSPLFYIAVSLFLHLAVLLILGKKYSFTPKEDVVEIQLLQISHDSSPAETDQNIQNDSPSSFEKVSHQSNQPEPQLPQQNISKPAVATSQPSTAVPTTVATAPTAAATPALSRPAKPTYDTVSLGIQVSYPRLSRVFEEQGQVILSILKNSSNQIEKVAVEKSSGFSRLDEAALEAAKHHDFSNIKTENEFKISFVFKLK